MRAVAFLLVGCPILITADAWRFPARAWRVAGSRRWLWTVLPTLLVGAAFVPFGDWWFRSLVLAADASCVPYLAKVRPMLCLDCALDVAEEADHHDGAGTTIARIEAHPAHQTKRSSLISSFAPYGVQDSERSQPHVVAVNGFGQERVLFLKTTWDEAVEAKDRVEDDLQRMGLEQWKQFYGVPNDFAE